MLKILITLGFNVTLAGIREVMHVKCIHAARESVAFFLFSMHIPSFILVRSQEVTRHI